MHSANRTGHRNVETAERLSALHGANIHAIAWTGHGGAQATAYEQERTRLSRELHDDIAQRIAILSAELGILQRMTKDSQDIQECLARLVSDTASIGSDLHRIARGLHPSGLERLGLEESIRRYCAQLAHAREIAINLDLGDLPAPLDMDVALCLYRIAQEALHNVVKHSGACRAAVSLATTRGVLVLRITDCGVGFEPHAMRLKDTLGLSSMRERARLVGAQLLVSSKPGRGTTVEARVPVRLSFVSVSS